MSIKRNKKASRNKNLTVLSHEHHHGLIFCSRLKKATNTTDDILRAYILDFWEKYLVDHFINEELVFLPYLGSEELTLQFLHEHKIIRELIAEIKKPTNKIQEQATQFRQLIYDHIRFEERAFFPWLEKTLNPEQLTTIGKKFEEMEVTAHDFTPKFWE